MVKVHGLVWWLMCREGSNHAWGKGEGWGVKKKIIIIHGEERTEQKNVTKISCNQIQSSGSILPTNENSRASNPWNSSNVSKNKFSQKILATKYGNIKTGERLKSKIHTREELSPRKIHATTTTTTRRNERSRQFHHQTRKWQRIDCATVRGRIWRGKEGKVVERCVASGFYGYSQRNNAVGMRTNPYS